MFPMKHLCQNLKKNKKKYIYNGKNLADLNESNQADYFEQSKYCDDRWYIYKRFQEKRKKEEYEIGDAWRVGYHGKCEVITSTYTQAEIQSRMDAAKRPGIRNLKSWATQEEARKKEVYLPQSYSNVFKRYQMPSRIINISSSPIHKFFINNPQGYGSQKNHCNYEIKKNKCKFYPVPIVTPEMIKKFLPGQYCDRISNSIGPFQKLGDTIWFCNSFDRGEGTNGVGGIGYFDLSEKKYHMIRSLK